ncbi:hypothetical protein PILCRDRAFT_89149 [Piloderma croceum F 1598]|uniref:Uncharacterized protein n=1 Tax=Piloderma croceum (strain F 1598) TaxID=765440 RepID=A0A0C3FQJ5_PILCF|nr:hypothetical protein PILCRDRAFT_89149 [Piloderma croceum F 1598]
MLQHLPTAPLNDVGIGLTKHLSDLLSVAAARRMLNTMGHTNVTGSAQYGAGYAGRPGDGAGNGVRQCVERNTGEAGDNHDGSTADTGREFDYGLSSWVDKLDAGSNQSDLMVGSLIPGFLTHYVMFLLVCTVVFRGQTNHLIEQHLSKFE